MPDTPPSTPRATTWTSLALVVAYALVLVVAAVAMARRADALAIDDKTAATRVALGLLLIEATALAVGVPFLDARRRARGGAWSRDVALPTACVAIATCLVSAVPGGGLEWTALVGCQMLLLCFAGVLSAGMALLAAVGLRPAVAQLVASAAGLAMLGSVFYTNALIERAPAGPPRARAIQAVLWVNPWIVAGGSLLHADPVRARRLYHRSVISYYGFTYPLAGRPPLARTLGVSAAYAACALALSAAARLAGRLRRPR